MNTKNNFEIGDLRNQMFKQLERLQDPDCNLEMEIKRSTALVNVGNVIVNSAKAEVDFLRVTKGKPTGFINGTKQKQLANGK